jgi:hypothetical protein
MKRPASSLFLATLLAAAACGGDPGSMELRQVDSGVGTSAIAIALAGVSLADDCAGVGQSRAGGACAATTPNCNSCRQSEMQLKITARGAPAAVTLAIKEVRIVDPTSGRRLGALTARTPKRYDGTTYVDWDARIAPDDDFNAMFLLSAPDWSTLSPATNDATTSYRIEVDLSVGGEARTIKLDGVTREPPIAT